MGCVCMYVCLYVCMYMYVCMCVCMHVCVHVQCYLRLHPRQSVHYDDGGVHGAHRPLYLNSEVDVPLNMPAIISIRYTYDFNGWQ
jgi:hypothetical protein